MSEVVTVVEEFVRGDRIFKRMSDGTMCVENIKTSSGTQYGEYVVVDGEVTKEKIAAAKEELVEKVCNTIKEIAARRDDFFIIKEVNGNTTVAHKFFLPTVNEF